MTDPRTGPGSEPSGQPDAGQMGSGGMGPGHSGAAGTGAGDAGATSSASATGSNQAAGQAGSVTTAPRTAGQAGVPQQYGPAGGREYGGDAAYEQGMPGRGADEMIAATAGRSWGTVLLGGLALIAVGVMLLVWPSVSLTIVAILIGAAVVASGVVRLWEGFSARANESGGMRTAYVVIGLLAVIVGVYLIRHHAVTLFLVAFVTGLYFIVHGFADLGVAVTGKGVPGRGLRAVLGVFGLAAGIVLIAWPGLTLTLLFLIVAAWLFFYGLVLCALAVSLRKVARSRPSSKGMRGRPVAAGAR